MTERVLARNVREVWGADGERWLAALPTTLAALARDWRLDVGEPYPMTFHWVCRVRTADGTRAVLKVGLGDLHVEAAALAAWSGRGAVRLLRQGDGALLLARAEPGTTAAALVPDDDEQATAALVGVAHRLHQASPPAGVPTLSGRLAALDTHLGSRARDRLVPRHLVERARGVAVELLDSAPEPVLLHGDLHHDNVLRSGDGWLAIDPHGVVGDPGYEVGAWLYNPDPDRRDPVLTALVPARLEQLADGLRQHVDRLAAWGFVQAALSAVWTTSSGREVDDRTLDVAALLGPRLR